MAENVLQEPSGAKVGIIKILSSYKVRMTALAVLFLIGVGIAAYPFISNAVYQDKANTLLDELDAVVAAGDPKAYARELERAREYNQQLVGQTVPDVFAIREGTTDKEYEGFLNVMGNLVMGKVQIPVIGVSLPIYHYSTEDSLLKGCGHIFGSSLPVGGESSHSVITAHRGLPAAKLFTDLDQLQLGDKFYVTVLNETMAYEVDNIEVVAPTETRSLAIQRGEDLMTLVTCTPYGVNTDRLLVRGHRIPYTPDEEKGRVAPHASALLRVLLQMACVAAGAGAALGVRWLLQRRKKTAEAADDAAVAAGDFDVSQAESTGSRVDDARAKLLAVEEVPADEPMQPGADAAGEGEPRG